MTHCEEKKVLTIFGNRNRQSYGEVTSENAGDDERGRPVFLLSCSAHRCPFAYRARYPFEAQRRADFHADHHRLFDV